MRRWLSMLVLLLAPTLGHAATVTTVPDCTKPGDWDSRCDWMEAGVPDLPAVAAHGDEVIRIEGLWGRVGADYLLELRHPRAGGYLVVIHNPYAPDAAIVRPVSRRAWDGLAALRIGMLTSRLRLPSAQAGSWDICVDSPGVAVDSVLRGKINHFETFDCTYPAIGNFFRRAPVFVYRLVPDCMKLNERLRYYCGSLGGDMTAALSAAPYVALWKYWGCEHRDADAVDPEKFLSPNAVLTVAVSAGVAGGTWYGHEIAETLCARQFDFTAHRIIGQGAEVRVEGSIRRYWDEPAVVKGVENSRVANAPSTQVWRIDDGVATLQRWTVGTFGPAR